MKKETKKSLRESGELKLEEARKIFERRKTEGEGKNMDDRSKEMEIKKRRSSEPTDFKIPKKVKALQARNYVCIYVLYMYVVASLCLS